MRIGPTAPQAARSATGPEDVTSVTRERTPHAAAWEPGGGRARGGARCRHDRGELDRAVPRSIWARGRGQRPEAAGGDEVLVRVLHPGGRGRRSSSGSGSALEAMIPTRVHVCIVDPADAVAGAGARGAGERARGPRGQAGALCAEEAGARGRDAVVALEHRGLDAERAAGRDGRGPERYVVGHPFNLRPGSSRWSRWSAGARPTGPW